jgi:Helitron helicase-like domain at N-terminus
MVSLAVTHRGTVSDVRALNLRYLCDMYSRVEEENLNYIRRSLNAQVDEDGDDPDTEDIVLPTTFLGSRKWASEQTADSLALARTYGPPSLFITMTCNSNWPEIRLRIQGKQEPFDTPIIIARAFKLRLRRLLDILRNLLGSITYITYSIEFQKRGYPHAHIVLQVRPSH